MTERAPGSRRIQAPRPGAALAVLLAFLVLLLAAPHEARATADDTNDALARIQEKGFLKVAVYRNFGPFHDDGKGGIDDDIGAELAHRLGVRVSVVSYMPGEEMGDDFRNAIWKGHYMGLPVSDVMLHVPVEEALIGDSPQVEIFGPYAKEETVVVYDSEQLSNWKGMESLGGLRAGVERESMPDLYMLSFGGPYKNQVDHFPDLAQAVDALRAGKVSAVIGSRTKIEAALGDAAGTRYHSVPFNGGVYGKPIDLGLAVKKGEQRLHLALEQAVAQMRADGAMARIYGKYHAQWVAPD